MKSPDYPDNEKARVQALAEYEILDTPSEEAFDNLTRLVANLLEVPFALVSLVDSKRQWFKSRHGLDATETSREISFCGHVVESGLPLIVENTLEDERFFDNPLVTDTPGIRFYAGYPLTTPQGFVLGAICAIDTKERKIGSKEIEILSLMAKQTMKLLELHKANIKIEEEHARLEAILETNVDAIISIDEKGIIEMANPSALKVLGYQSEEMLGKNVSMIVPSPNKKKHDHHIQRYLETGKKKVIGCAREAHAQNKDGTLLPVELSLSEVRFGDRRHFAAIIRDITDRCNAQQKIDSTLAELEKSEQYLHQVLNQLQVGTLFVDERGVVEYSTKKCLALLEPVVNRRAPLHWTDFLRVEGPMKQLIGETIKLPEVERRRLLVAVLKQGEKHWFELEIKDDAADQAKRVIYFYDADEIVKLRERVQSDRYGAIIGKSRPLRDTIQMLERVAAGDWTVMVEGDTGTGKELAARHIHDTSHRKNGPFVAVNCAGLNDSLLTSQLFGHKKGSFTGAISDRQGFFEAATGGTLFLDEIGDISPQLQASLLRVLQEKEILRVGDTKPVKVDARVIVATNRDLQQEAEAGRFRQDLLYRIRVARVRVPPLRERREDIPILANYFFEQNTMDNPKTRIRSINPAVFPHLVAYQWPGNIRELKGAIDYAWIHCTSDQIRPEDLPHEVFQSSYVLEHPPMTVMDDRAKIVEALQETKGNRKEAAALLNISRATLYRHLRKYGLDGRS